MRKFFSALVVLAIAGNTYAQSNMNDAKQSTSVTIESIKQQCASLPMVKRATVSVSTFTVTTTTTGGQDAANEQNARNVQNANRFNTLHGLFGQADKQSAAGEATIPVTLGPNLSTMLTNALQDVNCYRVLESLKKIDNTEIDSAANGGYASHKNGIKKGKQLSAQIVVQGEVTEYSVKEKSTHISFVNTSSKTVKLGFNLQMYNPATREVIASQSFRVQTKVGGGTTVYGIGGGGTDPDIAAVMQDGIVQAVQYMARVRDSLNITADYFNGATAEDPNATNETDITLNNANFSAFSDFGGLVSGLPMYKNMDKSFSGGVATFSVTHSGSADKLLDELNKKLGTKYEVTGFGDGKIELKVK